MTAFKSVANAVEPGNLNHVKEYKISEKKSIFNFTCIKQTNLNSSAAIVQFFFRMVNVIGCFNQAPILLSPIFLLRTISRSILTFELFSNWIDSDASLDDVIAISSYWNREGRWNMDRMKETLFFWLEKYS